MSPTAQLTALIQLVDPELEEHSGRVAALAEAVARRLGWDEARVAELRMGASLHDVGKMNLRPEVLGKPGALDREELAHVRSHPVEGVWLIAGVRSLARALPYVLFHHERWDGAGYPTRRAGLDIPVEGRLLALADAFDAMTSPRPYRPALDVDDAVAEIDCCAGAQFDPELAGVFLDAYAAGELVDLLVPG